MRHYREEVDAYWFREYKKNELVNKTWKIEKRELEKRAGGHYVLNPKVFKVWTEDELPSDPKEPIYIFIKDL